MTKSSPTFISFIMLLAVSLTACEGSIEARPDVLSTKSSIELRAMQARMFDTSDTKQTIKTVIATLQDLGYSLDKVSLTAGTVGATKLGALVITVMVTPHGKRQIIVRANAIVKGSKNNSQVDDPMFYQQLFFEPLAKAMFLKAQQVDG